MKQLSNKETKELEYTTTPLSNILYQQNSVFSHKESETMMFRSFDVVGWAHNGRFYDQPGSRSLSNGALHKQVAEMSKLLGFKQNYHIVWSLRNAVWGLQIDDLKFILYICTEGTRIQVEQNCNDASAKKIIDRLYSLLIIDPALSE
jgi:hypothetical protein